MQTSQFLHEALGITLQQPWHNSAAVNPLLNQRPAALLLLLRCGPGLQQVIPRINPLLQPTASYISEDRQRLLLRLDMYALKEREVIGDGSCQVSHAHCLSRQHVMS